MPDPPSSGLLTRFVFENPYPLVILFFVVAIGLAFSARQDILGGRMRVGGALVLAAVALLLVGHFVETPGERSAGVVREFVQLVKEGAIARADNLIGAAASITDSDVDNPGLDRDFIIERLDRTTRPDFKRLAQPDTTVITQLDAFTVDADSGVVHLWLRTDTQMFGGVPTAWVMEVDEENGVWKIDRIVWMKLATEEPPANWRSR